MSITDLNFLGIFLPVTLLGSCLFAGALREIFLLGASLVFYALGCPSYLPLLLGAVLFNVLLGRIMGALEERDSGRTLLLGAGVLADLCLLVYFKFAGGDLPMGLSFFTFKAISYLADVHSGRARLHRNPFHDALYLTLFAQVIQGPLSRYGELEPVSEKGRRLFLTLPDPDRFSEGVFRFMTGFNKKILLAGVLQTIAAEVFAADPGTVSTAYAWLGSIAYSLQLYYDFAGYSDMAVGLTRMLGYDCAENFDFPYMTESIARFWRRWHISLGAWFRDYVYIPLGGSRKGGRGRLAFNLLAVWLLTGLWHGTTWNFVVWGLVYFILILFERLTGLPGRISFRPLRFLYRIGCLVIINFQWVIFRADSLGRGLALIGRMLLPHGERTDLRALFLLRDNRAFLLAALVFCFPLVPALEKRLQKRKGLLLAFQCLLVLLTAAFFVWSLSYVIAGASNPFEYQNF